MNKKEIDVTIKVHRNIEFEKIKDTNFIFYKETTIKGVNGNVSKIVNTGVTLYENINSVSELSNISDIIPVPKMYSGIAYVAGIKKDEYKLCMQGKKHITEVINKLKVDNIDDLDDYILVLWNPGSHKIMDLNYNFISIPIEMDYINGSVSDEYYDLNKLLKKLKKDPNVLDRDNISITDIPYYNRTEWQSKTIDFKYLLPNDIYSKIADKDSFYIYNYILKNVIDVSDCKKD